jgi:drug/metabolite transporter (DMT)-like permease
MKTSIPRTQRAGMMLALVAATISGVAVFANGIAVKQAPGPISFTTAKNVVAAGIIIAVLCLTTARRDALPSLRGLRPAQWLAVGYVGIISGGVAFALFFSGLAQANATEAAFVQKTLIIWVALLAVPILHEQLGVLPVLAIGALVLGQVLLTFGTGAGKAGTATALALVLLATLLWSVEIVILRRLLLDVSPPLIGAIRMGVGSIVLLGWLAVTGSVGQLVTMGSTWSWALLTGVLLSGYVLSWFGALRRAQAVDVTAVLVLGAFITALLSMTGGTTIGPAQLAGLVLIAGGVAAIVKIRTTDHAIQSA